MSWLTALSSITAITNVHQWNNNSANISINETNCNVNNVHSPLEWSSNYLYMHLFIFTLIRFCSFGFVHFLCFSGAIFWLHIVLCVLKTRREGQRKRERVREGRRERRVENQVEHNSAWDVAQLPRWWMMEKGSAFIAINDHAQTFDFNTDSLYIIFYIHANMRHGCFTFNFDASLLLIINFYSHDWLYPLCALIFSCRIRKNGTLKGKAQKKLYKLFTIAYFIIQILQINW